MSELGRTVNEPGKAVEILDNRNDDLKSRVRRNSLDICGLTETTKEAPEQVPQTMKSNFKRGVKYENTEPGHGPGRQYKRHPGAVVKLIYLKQCKTKVSPNASRGYACLCYTQDSDSSSG